ncbi:MAG: hypothetical protein ACXWF8_05355 [Methylobacter sp.]
MHDHLIELKELFTEQNITSINKGIEALNQFFVQFEFHILKEEWTKMNRDERRAFVKTLLGTIENAGFTPSEIDSETIQNDISDEIHENENIDEIEEKFHTTVDAEQVEQASVEEKTELQLLLEQDVQNLLLERDDLLAKLTDINQKLKDLGHCDRPIGLSKMDVCRNWIKQNPNCKRTEFMEQFHELGSKAMLSTYWQKLKVIN